MILCRIHTTLYTSVPQSLSHFQRTHKQDADIKNQPRRADFLEAYFFFEAFFFPAFFTVFFAAFFTTFFFAGFFAFFAAIDVCLYNHTSHV